MMLPRDRAIPIGTYEPTLSAPTCFDHLRSVWRRWLDCGGAVRVKVPTGVQTLVMRDEGARAGLRVHVGRIVDGDSRWLLLYLPREVADAA